MPPILTLLPMRRISSLTFRSFNELHELVITLLNSCMAFLCMTTVGSGLALVFTVAYRAHLSGLALRIGFLLAAVPSVDGDNAMNYCDAVSVFEKFDYMLRP